LNGFRIGQRSFKVALRTVKRLAGTGARIEPGAGGSPEESGRISPGVAGLTGSKTRSHTDIEEGLNHGG